MPYSGIYKSLVFIIIVLLSEIRENLVIIRPKCEIIKGIMVAFGGTTVLMVL